MWNPDWNQADSIVAEEDKCVVGVGAKPRYASILDTIEQNRLPFTYPTARKPTGQEPAMARPAALPKLLRIEVQLELKPTTANIPLSPHLFSGLITYVPKGAPKSTEQVKAWACLILQSFYANIEASSFKAMWLVSAATITINVEGVGWMPPVVLDLTDCG